MENKYFEIDFGSLMTVCDKVLNLSIRSHIDITEMNDLIIRLYPPKDNEEWFFDVGCNPNSKIITA